MGTTVLVGFFADCLLLLIQPSSLAVVCAAAIVLLSRRRLKRVATACEKCRYSLAGLPEYSRCPECGLHYSPRIDVVSEWTWRPWIIPLAAAWLVVPALSASSGCLIGSWRWVQSVYGSEFGSVLWWDRVNLRAAQGAVNMVPVVAALGVLLSRWTGWRLGLLLLLTLSAVLALWTAAGVFENPGAIFGSYSLAVTRWPVNRVPFPIDLDVINGLLLVLFVTLALAQAGSGSSTEPWSPPPSLDDTGASLPGSHASAGQAPS